MELVSPSDPTRTKVGTYFSVVLQTFERATQAAGFVQETVLSIAGFRIRLRFAGRELARSLTSAVRHLSLPHAEEDDADFTVCIFDSASTGVHPPHPLWSEEDYGDRGVVRGFNDNRYKTVFQGGSNTLSLLDMQNSLGLFWVPDIAKLPFWEFSAPLRVLLHLWMREQGLQVIHAAAVGLQQRAVLLVGKGGAGKSTTALSCLGSKLQYLGDDYCLVGGGSQPIVYSLYSSAKIRLDDLNRLQFSGLIPSDEVQPNQEKVVFNIHELSPEKIAISRVLQAILIPRITHLNDSRLVPASSKDAHIALAPSTIFQLPDAGGVDLTRMANLVRSVDCFFLDLGTDMSQPQQCITRLLQGHAVMTET